MSDNSVILKDKLVDEDAIRALSNAFIEYYGDKPTSRNKILNPILVVADYIFQAQKAGLDQREQCMYAGSVLIFSILEETGRKHATDVNKVNKVYLAGIKLANTLWSNLDTLEASSKKIDDKTFDEIVQQMAEMVWLHTIAE